MDNRAADRLHNLLWALVILLLPITSFPPLARVAGGTMVAPAAGFPLFLILAAFTLPALIRAKSLPRFIFPLLALLWVAVLSTALSFFTEIPLFREINRLRNSISGFSTLIIGLGFYLAAASLPLDSNKLRGLYRWVNLSGLVILVWSLLQAAYWMMDGDYPGWMWEVQGWISVSGNLYDRRVTGLAFEPSWLGHQLVMFYLPYWLAATVTRASAFSRRVWGISIENFLLAGGIGLLLLSLSRSALVSFLLALTLLLLRGTAALVKFVQHRILLARQNSGKTDFPPLLVPTLTWAGVGLIYLAGLLAGLFVLSRIDPRMEEIFILLRQPFNLVQFADRLIFGERVAFWITGLEIFSSYPWLGVGLNNAGFFFPENMPVFAWSVVESHKMYYSTALPNTLSLWIRLLAETGVLGFGLFASWLVIQWKLAASLLRSQDALLRTAGLAGQLVIAALLFEGMSVDTFAFPYYWLSLGWMGAVYSARASSPLVDQGSGSGQTSSAAGSRQ